jgi:hypothetical protein
MRDKRGMDRDSGRVNRALPKSKSFASNLIFHWLLFAWLGWFAFPYLGESP